MMWSVHNLVRGFLLAGMTLVVVCPEVSSAEFGRSVRPFNRRLSPFNQALLIDLQGRVQVINARDAKKVPNADGLAQIGNAFFERAENPANPAVKLIRQLVIDPNTGQLFGAQNFTKTVNQLKDNFLRNIDKFRNNLGVRNFLLANGSAQALRGDLVLDARTGVLPNEGGFENYSAAQKASAITNMLLNSISLSRERINIPPARFSQKNREGVADMNLSRSMRGEALALLTNDNPYECQGFPKPAVRLDWLTFRAMKDTDVYYQLLGLSRTQSGFADQAGISADPTETSNNAILIGGTKDENSSDVVEGTRRVAQFEPMFNNPGGVAWQTWDSLVDKSGGEVNKAGDPLVAGEEFVHDGVESYGNLPNGFLWFGLFNGAGDRVNEAPDFLVAKPNISSGAECLRCHQGPGVRAYKVDKQNRRYADFLPALKSFGNKFTSMQRYASEGELFNKGWNGVRKSVGAWLDKTPGDPNSESLDLINGQIDAYKAPLSMAQVAKELGGATEAEVNAILPTVQGLRNLKDGTMPREQFEQYYCNFRVALVQLRQRGGPAQPNLASRGTSNRSAGTVGAEQHNGSQNQNAAPARPSTSDI